MSHFNMMINRSRRNIHISLMGDFDEKAVELLLTTLEQQCRHFKKIFIHTTDLNKVDDSAKTILHSKIKIPSYVLFKLSFTGGHAATLAPQAWRVI